VVANLDIDGTVVMQSGAVGATLEKCRVAASGAVGVLVQADGGIVQDCEVFRRGGNAGETVPGIWFDGADDCIARRNNIHGLSDGFYIFGDDVQLIDSYVHDLASPGVDPHYDGVQIFSPSAGIVIEHCNIDNPHPQTSAVTMGNNGGAVSLSIDNSRLWGGGWTLNIDDDGSASPVDVHVTNCRLGGGSAGSPFVTWDVSPPATWSGNVNDTTGAPITIS
jgi:hypothetical protein